MRERPGLLSPSGEDQPIKARIAISFPPRARPFWRRWMTSRSNSRSSGQTQKIRLAGAAKARVVPATCQKASADGRRDGRGHHAAGGPGRGIRVPLSTFVLLAGTIVAPGSQHFAGEWKAGMIGKSYFERQASMLLRLAKSVKDPQLSDKLLAKAADLEEKATDAEQTTSRQGGAYGTYTSNLLRPAVDIKDEQSRAICAEIGLRLRSVLTKTQPMPPHLSQLVARLGELDRSQMPPQGDWSINESHDSMDAG